MLGLIRPTAGRILYRGVEMGGRRTVRSPELRGKLQLVFQEPAESLNPRLRLFELIDEPLRALKLSRADRERQVRAAARRGRTGGEPARAATPPRSAWGCSSASASRGR